MKQKIKSLLFIFFGRVFLQPLFEFLHLVSLKGMHFGPGATVAQSGERAVFRNFLRERKSASKPLVIFDVGANVGEYTQMVVEEAEKTEVQYHVYSFEPSQKAFTELEKKFTSNPQVSLSRFGIGKEQAEVMLYADAAGSGLGSLYSRDLAFYDITITPQAVVSVITLDQFCAEQAITYIDFLKLDIEGSEYAALQGAVQLLGQKKIRVIQFEFGGTAIDARVYFKDFYSLLYREYDIYRVLKTGLRKVNSYEERWEIFMTSNFIAKIRS